MSRFLGANPGTTVKDALEPVLLDEAAVGSDIDTATMVEVNFPAKVVAVVELGAIAGGVTGLDIEVVGSDDEDGLVNPVSYGRFSAIDGDNDNEERVLAVHLFKQYAGVLVDHSGSGNAAVRVVLRPGDYWQGNTRTA